jgi:hypothetical protein
MLDLSTLTAADFQQYVHQPFEICLHEDAEPIVLHLEKVTEFQPQSGTRCGFSLEFLGPASAQYLRQGLYPLKAADMPVLEIFITPNGPARAPGAALNRMRYEAIFN